jgi:peptidoglycan/LPS O-acetylase OafA/YrhL
MRSSSGQHFVALDHVRALAAFMVFTWHFIHGHDGRPIPFNSLVSVPFLDEGHSGVALFMVLSGYLFAALVDGKRLAPGAFFYNRAVRLLPLLLIVLIINALLRAAAGQPLAPYAWSVLQGLLLPTLPNGGWSLTVEFHFYLILPLLLWLFRRSKWLPLGLVAAAMLLRAALWRTLGQVQDYAYWTLIGRIDQFVLGMAAFHFRGLFAGKHLRAFVVLLLFWTAYSAFDGFGGFNEPAGYPSHRPVWIVLPTLEGLGYGALIAWYANSFRLPETGLSGLLGKLGECSYSFYLLHFFAVFALTRWVDAHLGPIRTAWQGVGWAAVSYLALAPFAWLSYRWIETPWFRYRRSYLRPEPVPVT